MYMSAGFGKCIEILHVIGDTLYNMDKPPVRPQLGPPVISRRKPATDSLEEDKTEIENVGDNDVQDIVNDIENVNISENKDIESNIKDTKGDIESDLRTPDQVNENVKEEKIDPVQEMDKLLEYCFLKACKTTLKKEDLPMITSTFFKNHVIGACPPGSTVDVKKSSYKKLSVFLANMRDKGLVETFVLKGVESLLSVKVNVYPLNYVFNVF